jgi:hypothetical protein
MNNQYTLYIEIDDAKLMTKKERFNSLIQLLQYGKLQEFLPGSLILKSVNEQMPGLIPESLIKKLETNENAQQPQQPGQQQLGINPSNQAVPQQSGAGVTPTAPAVSNDDVPNSVFNMEINNYVNKLTDAGIPEKQIGDLMDQVGLMIDKDGKTLIPKPDENKTKAEILDDLEILSNKFLNIFSRRR